jgi:hypothetical protein
MAEVLARLAVHDHLAIRFGGDIGNRNRVTGWHRPGGYRLSYGVEADVKVEADHGSSKRPAEKDGQTPRCAAGV